MDKNDFAKRLAELRIAKGVSARDMSLSLGQSAGYINNIENGVNLPSMAVFFYICEYLSITPKEFFDTENNDPEKAAELYRRYGDRIVLPQDLAWVQDGKRQEASVSEMPEDCAAVDIGCKTVEDYRRRLG